MRGITDPKKMEEIGSKKIIIDPAKDLNVDPATRKRYYEEHETTDESFIHWDISLSLSLPLLSKASRK